MEHYYSKEQTSTVKLKKIDCFLRGQKFSFVLSSGIFSKNKIDFGTEFLCNNMILKRNWRCLDLGCGAGVIGVVASKFVKEVYLSDVNKRACEVSLINTNLNSSKNTVVVYSDIFEGLDNILFDCILLNPPQTAGRRLCFKMIEQSKDHLKKGGVLQVVVRHNKGGSVLANKIKEVFLNLECIAKSGGYRIYVSHKS